MDCVNNAAPREASPVGKESPVVVVVDPEHAAQIITAIKQARTETCRISTLSVDVTYINT